MIQYLDNQGTVFGYNIGYNITYTRHNIIQDCIHPTVQELESTLDSTLDSNWSPTTWGNFAGRCRVFVGWYWIQLYRIENIGWYYLGLAPRCSSFNLNSIISSCFGGCCKCAHCRTLMAIRLDSQFFHLDSRPRPRRNSDCDDFFQG